MILVPTAIFAFGLAVSPGLPESAVTAAYSAAATAQPIPEINAVSVPEDIDIPEEVPHQSAAPEGSWKYSSEWTDEALATAYHEAPESLGSVSVGLARGGRVINSVQLPDGDGWTVGDPRRAWATQETIEALVRVASRLRQEYPTTKLRLSHIGFQNGGWLPTHKTHQSGIDVDIGFSNRPGIVPRSRVRGAYLDPEVNWALIKSLIVEADIQFILVDTRIQRALKDYALAAGEPKPWVESLFSPTGLIRYARGHRDHFHVRFWSPKAQELGRRLAVVLNADTRSRVEVYQVKKGDTLSHIAEKFHTSTSQLMRHNNLKSTFLSLGRTIAIPTSGPCRNCPVPPPFEVPPRRLPPETPKS